MGEREIENGIMRERTREREGGEDIESKERENVRENKIEPERMRENVRENEREGKRK